MARRRDVRAWILYDVGNSAFATTVLAAVFPVYYASVAGATLSSPATATQYYSVTLSASVLVLAVVSPILGAFADVTAGRKRLLAASAAVGIVATAGLASVGEGDWLLASVLFAVARLGFGSSIVCYDALLPVVADRTEVDRISAQGFAAGYGGGGVLLAINVATIFAVGEVTGTKLSFGSVAVWWTLFTIPLLRWVREPAATAVAAGRRSAWRVTWRRVRGTWRDLRAAPDLRRFLVAFLVYNDAIGTVIALAAVYASELQIGTTDVILALLLVQFSGMVFSLVFGRLPERDRPRQPLATAFVVLMIVFLPLAGIGGRLLLPPDVTGVIGAAGGESSLPVIAALLVGVALLAGIVAVTVGRRLVAPIARRLDTKGGIILALSAYVIVAAYGFVLGSVLEFWCLALMVGVVQGGSQALSRSLYATLVPEAAAGEYFGFFSTLEKFASVLSPLLFTVSVAVFSSSRPAVLGLSAFFLTGIWLLRGVDVERGRALAERWQPQDARPGGIEA